MKKQGMFSLILCAAMVLTGCAPGTEGTTVATATVVETTLPIPTGEQTTQTATQSQAESVFSNRDLDASYSEADSVAIMLNGTSISCDSSAVTVSGTTATITEEGTYLLSGTLEDGSIVVDADKAHKIQLVLQDVSIHSETSAPIYIRQADKVFLTLAADTENTLTGGSSFTPDGDTNIDSVIFSKEDLTLNGTGTLTIHSPAGHGIVSKDSLRITGGTYVVSAASHGLSGKDEVSIASGSFAITAGKDGIHAENSEDTDRGTIYLEGGTYRITAEGDGISASGSCQILDGAYAITTGGGSENAQQNTSTPAFGRGQMGGAEPADAMSNATKKMDPSQDIPERGGERKSDMGNMGGKGSDRMAPPQENGNGQERYGMTEETDTVSTKGIKASTLTIEGGTFTVDSADDGLHSNSDLTLWGGTLEISSGDDGIHGDGTVTIRSGCVDILKSYEGIEGQHVEIYGGEITLTATDDGLNAAGGRDGSGFGRAMDTFTQSGDTPSVLIAGGTVTITAYGDGIDANGTLEITGGTVTVTGPTYGDTSVLDYDLSGTITGGTFIGTGASMMAQTFSDSSQGVISVNVGTQSAGTKLTLLDSQGNEILSHTPGLDYTIAILSTPEIRTGEGYTLQVGSAAETVTAK